MAEVLRIRCVGDLESAIDASADRPLVLLKHSTRCPASAHAHGEFERFAAGLPEGRAQPALILVVEDRAVSIEAARRLEVTHESPQAIVIVGGRVVWHGSHGRVVADGLRQALDSAL